MPNCDICGTLRLNGTAITEREKGWVKVKSPNPANPKVKFACRNCAKRRLQ